MHFLTVEDIAKELHVSSGTVRNKLSSDEASMPPSVKFGNRRLFPSEEFEKWVTNLKREALSNRISDSLESTSGLLK